MKMILHSFKIKCCIICKHEHLIYAHSWNENIHLRFYSSSLLSLNWVMGIAKIALCMCRVCVCHVCPSILTHGSRYITYNRIKWNWILFLDAQIYLNIRCCIYLEFVLSKQACSRSDVIIKLIVVCFFFTYANVCKHLFVDCCCGGYVAVYNSLFFYCFAFSVYIRTIHIVHITSHSIVTRLNKCAICKWYLFRSK